MGLVSRSKTDDRDEPATDVRRYGQIHIDQDGRGRITGGRLDWTGADRASWSKADRRKH